ncbi:MAG: PspA-associated protein PspAB [Acidimicrobiales bacterium]
MGLLDTLMGRTKPVRANLDALFALPSAAVTLETAAGLALSGRAGICWKPPAGRPAEDVRREIAELLDIPDDGAPGAAAGAGDAPPAAEPATPGDAGAKDAGAGDVVPAGGSLAQAEDAYGYRWLLLQDPDVDGLVTRVHVVNTTLEENGWGPQLLCSVFGLVPGPEADPDTRALFLVYLYKRGTFYPFAPDGKEHRDSELELRIRAVVGADLPVEADLSRWFPLWDLPVR